jgi:hypothetical protein
MKQFAPPEYLLDISEFTKDPPSVIPTPHNTIRAVHSTYPVNVTVPASTNKEANRAPWGLGANFVEFIPSTNGDLTITFDGADGFAWRAWIIATSARGNWTVTDTPVTLDAGSSGSVTVPDFGTRWSKVTLVPTIANSDGREVPYNYTASVQ